MAMYEKILSMANMTPTLYTMFIICDACKLMIDGHLPKWLDQLLSKQTQNEMQTNAFGN